MRTLFVVVGLLCATAPAFGQREKVEKWRIDPYTKNDPKALERAGYVRFAPFDFGEHAGKPVSTDVIEETLGEVRILWVETAHFKIGSSLPSFPIPASDRKLKKKLQEELERLKKKIPKVNPKTRRLDPWLRLHLFAQRCEETYEDFAKRLDVTVDSFPKERGTFVNKRYMGEGIYLGQQAKYTVLMLEKASDYTRYLSLFIGRTQAFAQRWNFKTIGSQFIGTAMELESRLRADTGMHCHIVWNVVHNLINGYRFYSYDLPVWFNEGMAHWYSRRIDPDYALDFDQNESAAASVVNFSNWEPKVRLWMQQDRFRPVADLISVRDFGQLTKYDHLQSWSLVHYLMSLGDEKWRNYMNEVKGFIDPETGLAVAKDIIGLQRNGLSKAYGLNPLTLEERWKQWVLETYAVK